MINPLVIAVMMGLIGVVVGSVLALVTEPLPWGRDAVVAPVRARSWLSPRYLGIQFLAAGIGVWAAVRGGDWPTITATAILGWQLLLIAVVDAENFWLPDVLTWPLIATGLIATAVLAGGAPWSQIIGAIGGFVMLWGLGWLYRQMRRRDGLGGGDPFLFAGAGAWVGWAGLPVVLLWACAAGFVVVLVRVARRRSVNGADRLPFGAFLAIGIWMTWLFSPLGG